MKTFFTIFAISFFTIKSIQCTAAASTISDSLDIKKTIIHATITDFVTKNIEATCILQIKSKVNNISSIPLDLEGLVVDSVKNNTGVLVFNHIGSTLVIATSTVLNTGDSTELHIFYHGVPIADATWGGFSFNGNYAYQMGVGFNAQPHSFGRTWHPCFDNFVERSSYEFFISTDTNKKAICNGMLIDSTINNNIITWHWNLNEEIPSYLASVAVNSFTKVSSILTSISGNKPAEIYCMANQVSNVTNSFAHLQQSYTMLETNFGEYHWPKVGYTLVPFTAGAMEHATNIHIGNAFVDGTLNYETLIAHELSHHWFGDLITCSTAQDMWLNEGFASYCEQLHTEYMYGKDSYTSAVKTNHYNVLYQAHIYDSGYRAVAGMDTNHTYGMTVYNKGSDMIHTLRSYLGDSLFFNGLTSFLNTYKFQSVNTIQLKDFLTSYTGVNMNDFFNDWILQPGFMHLGIDSVVVNNNAGNFETAITIRQRKYKNNAYYNNIPLEIGIYNQQMQLQIHTLNYTGRCITFNTVLSYNPAMIVLDPNNKLSDAITNEQKIIKQVGSSIFNEAKCRVNTKGINTSGDSSLIYIEHNWVQPDIFKTQSASNGYTLADTRYWTVHGINLQNLQGNIQFPYDGSVNGNYIDSSWIKNTEDSIRLFYRPNAAYEWTFANDSLTAFNINDKRGAIYAKIIKEGQYCIGIRRSTYTDTLQSDMPTSCSAITSVLSMNKPKEITVFPNPTKNSFTIKNYQYSKQDIIKLLDVTGKEINIYTVVQNGNTIIHLPNIASGVYYLEINSKQKRYTAKIVVAK